VPKSQKRHSSTGDEVVLLMD